MFLEICAFKDTASSGHPINSVGASIYIYMHTYMPLDRPVANNLFVLVVCAFKKKLFAELTGNMKIQGEVKERNICPTFSLTERFRVGMRERLNIAPAMTRVELEDPDHVCVLCMPTMLLQSSFSVHMSSPWGWPADHWECLRNQEKGGFRRVLQKCTPLLAVALWVPNILLGPVSLGIIRFLGRDARLCRSPFLVPEGISFELYREVHLEKLWPLLNGEHLLRGEKGEKVPRQGEEEGWPAT